MLEGNPQVNNRNEKENSSLYRSCTGCWVQKLSAEKSSLCPMSMWIFLFLSFKKQWFLSVATSSYRVKLHWAKCPQLVRKPWLHPLNFNSTSEKISSSSTALTLKKCSFDYKIQSSGMSLSFPVSHSVSGCFSSLWELLQKGSLSSRCQSTGGKHVFQISLWVSLCLLFSFCLTHAHRFANQSRDRKLNWAICFQRPATYCQETFQEPKKTEVWNVEYVGCLCLKRVCRIVDNQRM